MRIIIISVTTGRGIDISVVSWVVAERGGGLVVAMNDVFLELFVRVVLGSK